MLKNILEVLILVGSVVAPFQIVDSLALDRHKQAVAQFMFGRRQAPFDSFESGIIRGLLAPLIREGKLRFLRVWAFSLIVAGLLAAYALLLADTPDWTMPSPALVSAYIAAAILISMISVPFDFISFRVTKALFVDRSPRFPGTVGAFLADVFLSSLGPLAVFIAVITMSLTVSSAFEPGQPTPEGQVASVLLAASYANGLSSLMISLVQVTLIGTGLAARILLGLSRLGGLIDRHSKAGRYPFTTLGLIFAWGVILGSHLFGWRLPSPL